MERRALYSFLNTTTSLQNRSELFLFFFQTTESGKRYENLASIVKQISPRKDLNVFSKTLHIPESFTVSRHVFAPPDVPPALVRLKKRPP